MSTHTPGETIGIRLKHLREERKLSLQDVADRAGATKSHIWELEQGRAKNPTIGMAVAIANALGVSLDYLTGLSTTMPDLHPEALRIACEIDALLRANGRSQDVAPDLLAVAKAIDQSWTEAFPEGPDGSRDFAGGIGTLSDDTVEIWRAARAAISKAGGAA